MPKLSSGEFALFLDSDDLLYPGALAAMVAQLNASGRAYCLGRIETCGLDGKPLPIDSVSVISPTHSS